MTAERAAGREHIPRYTRGFIAIRILQLIFALVCLGLTAYTISYIAFSGNCLMLFTSLVTIGATIYMITTTTCIPKTYNYWAVLALDIFLVIFWLVSFALLAWQAAWYFAAGAYYYGFGYNYDSYDTSDYDSYYDDVYDYDIDYKRGLETRDLSGTALTFGAILGAAAGLGGLNFLFFLISLIIHSCVTFRHRRAGLHSKPFSSGTTTTAAPVPQAQQQQATYAPQPMGQVPHGYPPQQQQGYYPPQQQQQQYYTAPPQGSPVPMGGDVSKSSSPQPQMGGYAAPYGAPSPVHHPQAHEAPSGYPPQQGV